jgi:hypothetical protein
MLGIYRGCPAVFDPETGFCVAVYPRSARGWSRAVSDVRFLRGAV